MAGDGRGRCRVRRDRLCALCRASASSPGQGHPGASWPLCWASCRPRGQMHVCCIRDLCATYNIILNPSYSRIWSKLLEKMQEAGTSTGTPASWENGPGTRPPDTASPASRPRPEGNYSLPCFCCSSTRLVADSSARARSSTLGDGVQLHEVTERARRSNPLSNPPRHLDPPG